MPLSWCSVRRSRCSARRTRPTAWRGWLDHTLQILLIAALTWLLASLVLVAERRAIARYGGGDVEIVDDDRQWRRIRTQVTVLRRLAMALVIVLGGAAILMTFPTFSDIGTTVFASAGVLSVVAGLAAQTSLGAVFAGMQIAFSGAIRVGDVVQLENGQWWGRIEEITLSYVVVRLWDERRLVLPCTYFTTEPFENWTRSATEIMGAVEFDVDFSVPFARYARRTGPAAGRERSVGWPSRCAAGDRRRRRSGSRADRGQRAERRRAVRPAVRGARGHGRLGAAHGACCRRSASRPRHRHRNRAEEGKKRVASSLFYRQPQRPPLISDLGVIGALSATNHADPRRASGGDVVGDVDVGVDVLHVVAVLERVDQLEHLAGAFEVDGHRHRRLEAGLG